MKISVILEMLTANFETDAKRAQKALDKSVREMEQTAKRAGVAIGAGLASAATALAALGVNAINTADKLNDSSQRTGVMVEALSRLKYAAEQSGTSFEAVEKGLLKLSKEADAGGKNLARIGVTVSDAAGRMRPMNDILLDVAERFGRMDNATEKAAAAQAIFGKAGAALIPMLSEGKAGLQAMAEEAEALGVVFSTDAARAAAAFNDNLDKLKSAAVGLGNDIATELLPALLDVTNAAIEFVKQIREDGTLRAWIQGIKDAAQYIDELAVFITARLVAGALASLGVALASTAGSFTVATTAANAFRLALALAGGPIGLLVTGVAALAVVVYNYEDAADLSKAANDNLRTSIEGLNKATGDAIQPSMDLAAQRKAEAIETLKAAAANLKFAETQLAVAELSRDSDPTSNLEGMLSQDAAERIKKLGAEIETTKQLLVEYDAAQAGASDRLRTFKEEAKKAGEETDVLGTSAADTADKAKLLEDALKRAADEEERMVDWTRQLSDAADNAANDLGDMASSLASDLGGPAVSAAQAYVATLDRVRANLADMARVAPLTAEQLAQAAFVSDAAWTKYQETLKGIGEQEEEAAARADTIANRVADAWAQAADQMAYAWGDLLTWQFDKFSDFAGAIKDIWLRAVADMIAASARSNFAGMLGNGSGAGIGAGGAATATGGAGGMMSGLLGGAGALLGGTGLGTGLMASASIFSGAGLLGGITGSIGAGVASIAGGAFMQGVGLLLGPVGLIVGAVTLLTSIFKKDKPPDFRVGGADARVRNVEGGFSTVFGDVQAGSRQISWESLVEPMQQFDVGIQSLVTSMGGGQEQLDEIRDRLSTWVVDLRGSAATAENVLGSRFSAILTTFSDDVQQFVGATGTVEERVKRLAEALQIEGLTELGTLGDSFGAVAALLEDYRIGTEDLGATYSRIVASVELFESALTLTGTAFAGTREELVRFAADITDAAGGLDRAQALWSDYFDTFYTADQRAQLALSQARTGAGQQFADIGQNFGDFSGEGGAAAFRALFEQLLPTLSAEAVVQWLEAANALGVFIDATAAVTGVVEETAGSLGNLADLMAGVRESLAEFAPEQSLADQLSAINAETVDLVTRATALGASETELAEIRELGQLRMNALLAEQDALIEQQAAAASSLQDYLANLAAETGGGITPLTSALQSLRAEYQQHIARINDLAVASGRAGASQSELAVATEWYNAQVEALTQELIASASSIIARLYGASGGAVASGGGSSSGGGDLGGIQQISDAVDDRYQREMQYLEGISNWLDNLDLSALSPLTPAERLAEAQSTYQDLLARAQGGDLGALERLQGAAQSYLQESQSYTGGVGGYRDVFESVQAALRALADRGALNSPPADNTGSTSSGGGGMTVEAGASFQQLSELERFGLAQELTVVLRDLMAATGMSISGVADSLGLDLAAFVTDLGVSLNEQTVATTLQLADISRNLGIELTDLAASLGFGLGDLGDANSLANDALEGTIGGLPPDFRAELEPLLRDIEDAMNDADANAAVRAAEDAINDMPAGIRDLLAPFFEGVTSPSSSLLEVATSQAEDVADILEFLRGTPEPPSPGPFPGPGGLTAADSADKFMVENTNVIELAKYREEAEALRAEVARGNRMMASLLSEGNLTAQTIAARVGGAVAQTRSR